MIIKVGEILNRATLDKVLKLDDQDGIICRFANPAYLVIATEKRPGMYVVRDIYDNQLIRVKQADVGEKYGG
jgi:hypothetical protein